MANNIGTRFNNSVDAAARGPPAPASQQPPGQVDVDTAIRNNADFRALQEKLENVSATVSSQGKAIQDNTSRLDQLQDTSVKTLSVLERLEGKIDNTHVSAQNQIEAAREEARALAYANRGPSLLSPGSVGGATVAGNVGAGSNYLNHFPSAWQLPLRLIDQIVLNEQLHMSFCEFIAVDPVSNL